MTDSQPYYLKKKSTNFLIFMSFLAGLGLVALMIWGIHAKYPYAEEAQQNEVTIEKNEVATEKSVKNIHRKPFWNWIDKHSVWATLAAIALIPSLYLRWLWRRHETITQQDQKERELANHEVSQIPDRFKSAIEMIGDKGKGEINRVAGVYALARIMDTKSEYYWSAAETLATLIRWDLPRSYLLQAPFTKGHKKIYLGIDKSDLDVQKNNAEKKAIDEIEKDIKPDDPTLVSVIPKTYDEKPPILIQTALTELGRPKRGGIPKRENKENGAADEDKRLLLHGTRIYNAHLWDLDLSYFTLTKVDFRKSKFSNAKFRYANLAGSDFENAEVAKADFRGAWLVGADLRCNFWENADWTHAVYLSENAGEHGVDAQDKFEPTKKHFRTIFPPEFTKEVRDKKRMICWNEWVIKDKPIIIQEPRNEKEGEYVRIVDEIGKMLDKKDKN